MDSDVHSDSSSSLDDSGESADENDFNEACCFKNKLKVPECFCSDEEVFREVLGPSTWKSVFLSKHGDKLKKLLPVFPENDEKEKNETIRMLVEGENFKFGNPLKQFFNKLRDGFLSSDILEVKSALKKASYREYKNQQQRYYYNLLQDILISRKKLLDTAYTLPPGQAVKMQQFTAKPKDATLLERTRLRYFSTLHDLREEVGELDTSSEDENYPESGTPKVFKKHKKQLHAHENSVNSDLMRICSTMTHPPLYPGSGNFFNHCIDMFEVSEERYREMLQNHKQRMISDQNNPKLLISHLDLRDVTARTKIGKRHLSKNENPVKKKMKNAESSDKVNSILTSEIIEGDSSLSNIYNREDSSYYSSGPDTSSDIVLPSVQETEVQTEPLVISEENEDLLTVHDTHQINKLPSPRPEIHQYPTCFFALIRDIFCESAEQKLSTVKLEEKVRNWQGGPTASLFEWLNYQESWSDLVQSALKFLAGDLINILPDTFVPFLDYKEKQQQWQWIGSGRDSDEQMYGLCQQWLESKDDINSDILETCQGSPPPPRVTTGWTVRPTVDEEKRLYREQECVRYQNPHKAFTFKVHGYEAVVGPVKGVYGKESGINKAREHSLLTSDRPPFVTILSLVRDSAARLPNGEGTRADICELLKDSQYLAPASDQQIHTVVSGALDRLHYEKDPCVKYDVNRKLWIYLHRHRTEEEFERIHQAQAAAAKARKAVQKSKLPKPKNKDVARSLSTGHTTESGSLTNADITSGIPVPSPRGSSSPRTQGSPKSGHTSNRYIMHTLATSNQSEIKCAVLSVENQSKCNENTSSDSMTSNIVPVDKQQIQAIISVQNQETASSRQTSKNSIANAAASQIVSVTPVQIKSIKTEPGHSVNAVSPHIPVQIKSIKPDGGHSTNAVSSHLPVQIKSIKTEPATSVSAVSSHLPVQIKSIKTESGLSINSVSSHLPVQLKSIKAEPGISVNAVSSHVHDILNVDMKPSSPSFVGQPPVLQPILSHPNVEVTNTITNASTSVSSSPLNTPSSSVAKTKVNCANIPGLPGTIAGFQTIVIKQDPGLRTCNGVSTIPLLSIEERLPSTNASAINSAPVVARLVHGSQYLSFCNLAASSTTCSTTKPITAAVQNFRVQGGNICQQMLSTSTIKVINSTPVSAIADTRVPVIALKNQISGKEQTILTQSPAALNVCGRLYQMANIRNAVISKDVSEVKTSDGASTKDSSEANDKETKDLNMAALPIPTITYNGSVPITARATQTVLKVSPK